MHRSIRFFPPALLTAATAFAGIFLSKQLDLYVRWEQFDTALHVAGGFAIAWLLFLALRGELLRLAPWARILMLVSFTVLVGVLWEFAEYIAGAGRNLWPWLYPWFHGGNLPDTLTDLLADIVGALVFTISVPASRSPRSPDRV